MSSPQPEATFQFTRLFLNSCTIEWFGWCSINLEHLFVGAVIYRTDTSTVRRNNNRFAVCCGDVDLLSFFCCRRRGNVCASHTSVACRSKQINNKKIIIILYAAASKWDSTYWPYLCTKDTMFITCLHTFSFTCVRVVQTCDAIWKQTVFIWKFYEYFVAQSKERRLLEPNVCPTLLRNRFIFLLSNECDATYSTYYRIFAVSRYLKPMAYSLHHKIVKENK